MSAVSLAFLGLGGLSLLLLLASLRFRHLGRLGHLGHLGRFSHRLRLPGRRRSQGLSLPVTSGFLGGFGFGGAIAIEVTHRSGPAALLVGAVAGVVVGVPLAWAAGRFVAAVAGMHTDATPESAGVVGAIGVVISEIPVGGLGQVRLSYAGQPMKFNARADGPLALGVRVLVIGVPTPTSVLVTPLQAVLNLEEGS
jgi:membrane protein implicated in regulation of membrane protease activity